MTIYTGKAVEILFGTEKKAKEVLTTPYRLVGNLTEVIGDLTTIPFDTLVIHSSQLDLLLTDAAWVFDEVTVEVIYQLASIRGEEILVHVT